MRDQRLVRCRCPDPGPGGSVGRGGTVHRYRSRDLQERAAGQLRRENNCRRQSGDAHGGPGYATFVTTYDSVEAAAAWIASDRQHGGSDTPEHVGDESVLADNHGWQFLEFRRGRAVIGVDFEHGDTGVTPPDLVQGLLPVARAVAARVPAN